MTSLTRRNVVRTAAWSAPAITLATTAPAYAATGGTPMIDYDSGGSYLAPYLGSEPDDPETWDMYFGGVAILLVGDSQEPAILTMTVQAEGPDGPLDLFQFDDMPDWSGTGGTGSPLVLTHHQSVIGGDVVAITNGFYFGTDTEAMWARLTIVISASGYESATWVIESDPR